jgi:rhamnose utilization protein RhaD (predicted bifunctional aldolase and dehydrogenase)
MSNYQETLQSRVIQFSADVGANPLLVQGAGGNVSWKAGDSLWVKASGTWLADAQAENIFVEVDLGALKDQLRSENFAATPVSLGDSTLKPSIETLLHALMPHPVVAHLHAVDVLAHLVRADCDASLKAKLGNNCAWTSVGYQKPGALLAQAVAEALAEKPDSDVIFLKNHGVVIGGETPEQILELLGLVVAPLRCEILAMSDCNSSSGAAPYPQYTALADSRLHRLATQSDLFKRLRQDWALYPDHVVFLGPAACVYDSWEAFGTPEHLPELIFVRGSGVYSKLPLNKAKAAQLGCYYDVLVRQPSDQQLTSLSQDDIQSLLNWDAEQYRIRFAK